MFKTSDVANRYHVLKSIVRTWVEKGYLSCTRLLCSDRQFSNDNLQIFDKKYIKRIYAEGEVSE